MLKREDLTSENVDQIVADAHKAGYHFFLSAAEREARFKAAMALYQPGEEVWVFAYGSLMWHPAIEFAEQQPCRVDGWRRSFCFWMPMGRGTPELPGLMLALEQGGACEGIAYRLAPAQVESELGIPWPFVGVIHAMECGFNFYGHLHNGDPLTARTVHVPKGRPASAGPPYTWLQSALDALRLKKLDQVTDWSVPHMLFVLEGYNGFGYRRHGVPTPYLWSFSNLYESGKFVLDGRFDPHAVSKQCGAALMLKAVLNA